MLPLRAMRMRDEGENPSLKPRLSERRILLLLAAVQFTHIMDFMVMMPLGPQLMRDLAISPQRFGALISAFAVTAGVVGLLVAPFIDRFDRKKLLLICYAGFALGTLACGLAHTADMLMVARALCGAFGGVSGAVVMAIVADVVPPERRAQGMGIIMTSYSAAAALGVPLGLKMAQWWRWEAPFLVVAGVSVVVWIALSKILPPVRGHLTSQTPSVTAFLGLLKDANAWRGLLLMTAMVFGHFTIIPYLSPHLVGNVGMPEQFLFLVYIVGGAVTIFTGPFVGKLADHHGRLKIYAVMVAGAAIVIWVLTNSGPRPVWQVLLIAAFFFAFASGRFVPGQAVVSQAVEPARRGAYMSLVGCARDLASGITAAIGGKIIAAGPNGTLLHFNTLGWITIGVSVASLWIFRKIRAVG